MEDIQDSGKVWCKGYKHPIHAVRIENKIFATGKTDEQSIGFWVDEGMLCIDINEQKKEIRIAKKIPIELEPTVPGTIFNGFTHTKHADVLVVNPEQYRVEVKVVSGETYKSGIYNDMNSKEFWDKVWG